MKSKLFFSLLTMPLLMTGAGIAKSIDPVHQRLIPAEKGESLETLLKRGNEPVWKGGQLKYIGMPVSGIGTGQLYLSGDGRLWFWGVFNQPDDWSKNDGYRYRIPSRPVDFMPVEQGFMVSWEQDGKLQHRTLDASGFRSITFRPEFPVGKVEYSDPDVPFIITLTAFTPYIPTDLDNSTYPATVMDYAISNRDDQPVEVQIRGWIENYGAEFVKPLVKGTRSNRLIKQDGYSAIIAGNTIDRAALPSQADSEIFENFNGDRFEGWTTTGDAFGKKPDTYSKEKIWNLRGKIDGKAAISVRPDDTQTGTLISDPFTVEKPFINLTFAAGRHPGGAGLRLLVDGKPVRSMTGIKPRKIEERSWNVSDFTGRKAQIEIFDTATDNSGYVIVDTIEFSNFPFKHELPPDLTRPNDLGSLALVVTGNDDDIVSVMDRTRKSAKQKIRDIPLGQKAVASIGKTIRLEPGASRTATFVISWRYPIRGGRTRTYGIRWPDIQAQIGEVITELTRLRKNTLLFAETWRDSTLPHWLMNRIIAPICALNTGTAIDQDGPYRFLLMEGADSLGGNCTHVWQYAQGAARLFPELERLCRENVELGIGFMKNGEIKYRAGTPPGRFMTAMDGTTGTLLRVLREHQMSADAGFLNRVWPRVKRAMDYLIKTYDTDRNGITEGWQHNTLDADWAGDIPWLSSMYLAALSACEEMAGIVGDTEFAAECRAIIAEGKSEFLRRMWSDEFGYFVMNEDPEIKKPSPGTYQGVDIDQVLGEWWLTQVGLEPILDPDKTRAALKAIFRYNYTPDVGPYREQFPAGRWYAVAGEPGLLMATFPYGGMDRVSGTKSQAVGYLNECMTGFEWQAAAHMIEAGLVREGLQVVKALDDRYAPDKRNPYNEIECGDHYGRALASYSVLINLSGYEYDGPAGLLAFAPKVTPENFRAPFTVAKGWGTFTQRRTETSQTVALEMRYGTLELRTLEMELPEDRYIESLDIKFSGEPVAATTEQNGTRLMIRLDHPMSVTAGQRLDTYITTQSNRNKH